ncbi:MAG: alpha-2-macroglobulin, partial [Chitinophagaceae bacterium]|nr:alpha-2-macroglobulin [Chitinophagaceae bacterium]
ALISNLQKNPELKSALLEETPWVLQAKSEEEQKRNIALLFDLTKMSDELEASLSKVIAMQSSNGGFSWFKGGPDDRYITQYIITGIGHLQKLGAIPANFESRLMQVVKNAIPYLDKKMKEDHDEIVKQKDKTGATVPANIAAHYLYMRSFFPQFAVNAKDKTAYNYFKTQVKLHWTKQPVYMQGMIALTLHRAGDVQTTNAITRSLKERAITHSELGMYWKEQTTPGYFWHQAPIETQALMIETFSETTKDVKTVNQLRKWLLKNKQTNHWESTRATAEAVYALLLQGTDWLDDKPSVVIKAGNFTVSEANAKAEEGTGYIKKSIEGQQVNANMGNITVAITSGAEKNKKIPSQQVSWGAAYWQYFEDMDKVTFAETPLQLNKKLFIEKNTDRGPVLEPVEEQGLKIGDKIKVRIELRVDRDMEYVHMKDLRASALEPVNVLSNYKWQDGLGYYESTRDAATHFFFSYLRKGTYVFEYSLFVTHTGTFNNGITTIQSMYAPEFTSHSEGVRIRVE